MTAPAITIRPDAPIDDAARLMYDEGVKRLPVVNANGRLLGIISRVNVLGVLSRSDEDIQCEIVHHVLPGTPLAQPTAVSVSVRNGIVTISGEPQPEHVGRAVIDAVRHAQGVVGVRDHITASSSRRGVGIGGVP